MSLVQNRLAQFCECNQLQIDSVFLSSFCCCHSNGKIHYIISWLLKLSNNRKKNQTHIFFFCSKTIPCVTVNMLSGQKKNCFVCYIELSRVRKTQIPIRLDMHSGDIDFGLAWLDLARFVLDSVTSKWTYAHKLRSSRCS